LSSLEIKKQVEKYVEQQCRGKVKVIHSKSEQSYNELGFEVTVWNVKIDKEGSWWVVQGDLPMNLYPQDTAYYFSTDEVFSFHLGIMLRLMNEEANKPDKFIDYISNGAELTINLKRKLTLASEKLQGAIEIEEIQAIGVMCREILIELINYVYTTDSFEGEENYKKADVKNRGELVINKYLSGSENAELRKHIKSLLNGAWDFSNTITHSSSRTAQEASICLIMTTAIVSSFENILEQYHEPLHGLKCNKCGSRRLIVAQNEETQDLLITCENCQNKFIKE
jgi:hypothetical protein